MAAGSSRRLNQKSAGISYDQAAYWDERFASDPREVFGFEWLSPGRELLDLTTRILSCSSRPLTILHIGVGTSSVSTEIVCFLQQRFPNDWQLWAKEIINVDFSPRSIEYQRKLEQQTFSVQREGLLMHYHVLDLLDWKDVKDKLGGKGLDLVLDKSTTDSISTASDIALHSLDTSNTKFHPDLVRMAKQIQEKGAEVFIPTTQVLALNLSSLSNPGCRWLCHSYSSDRWQDVVTNMDKTIAFRWTQTNKIPVEVASDGANLHAPKMYHYVYEMQKA